MKGMLLLFFIALLPWQPLPNASICIIGICLKRWEPTVNSFEHSKFKTAKEIMVYKKYKYVARKSKIHTVIM